MTSDYRYRLWKIALFAPLQVLFTNNISDRGHVLLNNSSFLKRSTFALERKSNRMKQFRSETTVTSCDVVMFITIISSWSEIIVKHLVLANELIKLQIFGLTKG